MTIFIKVAEMMGRHRMTQKELAEKTGIRPATISALWHGTAKRIDFEQMNRLCQVLECDPGDLFDYVPDGYKRAFKEVQRDDGEIVWVSNDDD